MARKIVSIILTLSIVSSVGLAQTSPQNVSDSGSSRSISGPRRQLAIIIFAGLGGSVLGLSTLSFYGRPQDHLENIAIGFAVGIIIGTGYVTYKTATSPYDTIYSQPQSHLIDPPKLDNQPLKDMVVARSEPWSRPIQLHWEF